jgi:hypothetical protein
MQESGNLVVSSSYIDGTANASAIWMSNTTDHGDYAVLQDNGQLCIYLQPQAVTTLPVTCFGVPVGSDIGKTDTSTTSSSSSSSGSYDTAPVIAGSICAAVVLLAVIALVWCKRKGALPNSCKRSNSSRSIADDNCGTRRSAPFSTVRRSSSSSNNRKVSQRPRILTFEPSVSVESPVTDAEFGTTATAHDGSSGNSSNSSSRNSSSVNDSIATAAAATATGINNNNNRSQLQRSNSGNTGYYVDKPSKWSQQQQQQQQHAPVSNVPLQFNINSTDATKAISSSDRSLLSTAANSKQGVTAVTATAANDLPEYILVIRHMMHLCEDIESMFSAGTNSNCGEIVTWSQRLQVSH